jgi:thiamine-phosphate pyrophosphorylase
LNPLHQPPLLYLITDRQAFLRKPEIGEEGCRAQLEVIRLAAQSGVQLIQIREKDLSAQALAEFTREVIAVARPLEAKVLVNDRLDVALATNADGVHLRVNSLAVPEVREITKQTGLNEFLIGVSTHSMAEAQAAEKGGADFIVCGPVFDTPSKREYGAPLGLKKFSDICQALKLPVLALGGISLANLHEPLRHGAAGIAAIGLFTEVRNLQQLSKLGMP